VVAAIFYTRAAGMDEANFDGSMLLYAWFSMFICYLSGTGPISFHRTEPMFKLSVDRFASLINLVVTRLSGVTLFYEVHHCYLKFLMIPSSSDYEVLCSGGPDPSRGLPVNFGV
jgi:hypothetical protein